MASKQMPARDVLVAAGSYLAVLGCLYTAFQVFTTARVAANFLAFGPVGLALLGIGIPVFYTVQVRRRPLADLGLTTSRLGSSLLLGLVLGYLTYRDTLARLEISWGADLVPLVAMGLAVGLFEAVFFRGWLQQQFEHAFGPVAGLLLGALCYSLYHVGYGMNRDELFFLFYLGLVFGAVFRVTGNVFVLWPFYTPVGGLYTNLSEGLALPFPATYGFLLTLALMAGLVGLGQARTQRSGPMLRAGA